MHPSDLQTALTEAAYQGRSLANALRGPADMPAREANTTATEHAFRFGALVKRYGWDEQTTAACYLRWHAACVARLTGQD